MRVPFCFTSVLGTKQLPLTPKLFILGVNSVDWQQWSQHCLPLALSLLLGALCFQHGSCFFTGDHGPEMSFLIRSAFQPSVLQGLSSKLRQGLGETCGSMLHFQTCPLSSSLAIQLQISWIQGPNDQRRPRGSLAPASRSSPKQTPPLSLQNCNKILQCSDVPEPLAVLQEEMLNLFSLVLWSQIKIFDYLFQLTKGFLVQYFFNAIHENLLGRAV